MKVAKKDAIQAWWFSEGTTLPHGDGREVKIGVVHKVTGRIVACRNGLHGSENPLDALKYAPGAIVWRTRHWGTVRREDDKLCSTFREYVAGGVDASATLRAFARWCALQVYTELAEYDKDGIIKRWLETGDESIRSAAESAAWLAAWSTARLAAGSAAELAAELAAGSASWLAARSAAESAQGKKLVELLEAIVADK